ncbi:MAG TPA: hypothetical protein PL151_01270 [Phycisphaerae bacterium]|nr:hypothetical protein [Phycisphaerae bacterium]HOJ75048.1 hypothetical protein [Phycisphaerae bacterium]HOM51919.1 hypothetical protein [Phycisphaerae bacterium]HON65676.1 hypothetical protein [Phycisphaerae bacterium]HOQ86143.1 hypothetical protein [Phycisphaerae bacterium]
MRWRTCLALLAVGLAILIGGFVYDVLFAGIPYQDPTPELAARYARHARIARSIEAAGLAIWALGVVNAVLSWTYARLVKEGTPGPQSS